MIYRLFLLVAVWNTISGLITVLLILSWAIQSAPSVMDLNPDRAFILPILIPMFFSMLFGNKGV